MEIVVEYTLIISFMAHLLVLLFVGKVLKQSVRLKWLSCLIGWAVDLTFPLFHLAATFKILTLIFSLTLITLISFKYINFCRFLRDFALIFFITCVFGGVCQAFESLIGQFSLFVVSLILILSYVVSGIVLKSVDKANKIKQFTYQLKIVDDGKIVEEEGYLDSGNVLKDVITNKPIILVTFDVFCKLYNVNYLNALTKNYDFRDFKNGHFVDVKSVGGSGKMLVFSVDELRVGKDKSFKDAMLGLSFSGFEKSFGKNVLLNCEMI